MRDNTGFLKSWMTIVMKILKVCSFLCISFNSSFWASLVIRISLTEEVFEFYRYIDLEFLLLESNILKWLASTEGAETIYFSHYICKGMLICSCALSDFYKYFLFRIEFPFFNFTNLFLFLFDDILFFWSNYEEREFELDYNYMWLLFSSLALLALWLLLHIFNSS